VIDAQQDLNLIESKEENGYTILKFKRKLNTCDKDDDLVIKKETNYLIAAWNNNDPTVENGWLKHDLNSKRVKVDYLLGFRDTEEDLIASELEVSDNVEMKLTNVNCLYK
jgi:hypothetical protein